MLVNMDVHNLLQGMQLFSGFDDAEIEAFIRAAIVRSEPAGYCYLSMGAANSSVFIVCKGRVEIERISAADDIPIATLGVAETFGEMSFMDDSRATASVVGAEATEVLELSRETVDGLIDVNATVALKFWRNLALVLKQRLAKTNEVIDQYVDINQVLLQQESFRDYYDRL